MQIIGHEKQIKFLRSCLKTGKTFQAYIFSGPEAVGKFSLAKMFAENLILETRLFSFEKRETDALTDLIIIKPEKEEKKGVLKEREIKIEAIREAQKDLMLFPNQGRYRVLIIDNAHKITEASQNALLKTIEEPNSTSVIILVTSEEGKILPTVRSRCQKINFSQLPLRQIKNYLSEKKIKNADELALFSAGRLGLAIKMAEDRAEFQKRQEAEQELRKLSQTEINQRFDLAEKYSKNISETVEKLEFWIWLLRLRAFRDIEKKEKILLLYEVIGRIEKSLNILKNSNANSRLVLENLFLEL